jgi:hypothetical protein
VEQDTGIEHPFAVVVELGTAADEVGLPLTVRVVEAALVALGENDRPRGGVADRDRVGQDRAHPVIRREGPPFLDADGSQRADQFSRQRIAGSFWMTALISS